WRKDFVSSKDFEPALIPEKTIPDPDDTKLEDWDERAKIPDSEASISQMIGMRMHRYKLKMQKLRSLKDEKEKQKSENEAAGISDGPAGFQAKVVTEESKSTSKPSDTTDQGTSGAKEEEIDDAAAAPRRRNTIREN
ncbi:hypothetical protein GIB67_013602, partial [Kingdonia uniflora]